MTAPNIGLMSNLNQVIEIRDKIGRKLVIRRINALDRLRLFKAAGPELAQNDSWLNMAALALSVVEVNGIPRATPVKIIRETHWAIGWVEWIGIDQGGCDVA